MDRVKRENFERAHPVRQFPSYESLSREECAELRTKICLGFGIAQEVSGLEMVKRIHAGEKQYLGAVAQGGPWALRKLLRSASVSHGQDLLLNWYQFDEIDRMNVDLLSRHFDDIWYPSLDDLEIFDTSCGWFLVVSHDGRVELIRTKEGRHLSLPTM